MRLSITACAAVAFVLLASFAATADVITQSHALRIVGQYKGIFSSAPTQSTTNETTDAPLLGNGDVGVAIVNSIDSLTFVIGKNEFWSLNDKTVKAMARLALWVPGMEGASYSITQDIAKAEVTGTFSLGGVTISTTSWVQADDTVVNRFVTRLFYSGVGTKTISVSLTEGDQNSFPSAAGFSGDVLFLDVRSDNVDSVTGYATNKTRIATRIIGTPGTVSNNKLAFSLSSGISCALVTCIMSNYDSSAFQKAAIAGISSETPADIDSLSASHHNWWNAFYAKSFVEIPNKTIEKAFYGSLYLLASCSRSTEASPGLWANWTIGNPAWNSDYTLNYNYEAPFYMAFPTNHSELADAYDKPIMDWIPHAQAEATANGWTGAFYRVHVGPLPNGSADQNTWNQKSCGSFAATDIILHYYYTRDIAYANKIYNTLKQLGIFWQNYLYWDGTRYVILSDAQHEGNASPQTNGIMSLGLLRFLLQACIDVSSALNVDASERSTWQDRLSKLSTFPTFVRNGQTVFRYTEVGLDWNDGNAIGIQHIYPGSQIGLGSDSALLAMGKNMVGQMARWNDGNGTVTFYPAAARVGYDPGIILTNLSSWVSNNSYPNLHIHTGGGGIENLNTVPATLCEMLVQSFQNKLRLFSDWPSATYGKFGDLLTYGGFLASSDIESNGVQYVRLVSTKGNSCILVNPWPGQTLEIYRNGSDSGTVSGKEVALSTAVNETILLAPRGTSYNEIMLRMNRHAGDISQTTGRLDSNKPAVTLAINKRVFDRSTDKCILFSAKIPCDNNTERLLVTIYSVDGVRVARISAVGTFASWNMNNSNSVPVPSGSYVAKIKLERLHQEIERSTRFQIIR